AMDVYNYPDDQILKRENVIRVDADRLRRRMDEYYNTDGQSDSIYIALPKGSYTPEFTSRRPHSPKSGLFTSPFLLIGLAVALMIAFVSYLGWQANNSGNQTTVRSDNSGQKRTAIFETSPSRLQAVNLAAEGRDLVFPAIEPFRLKAALLVFESAISLDNTYFGGFAGAAHVHALVALVSVDPEQVKLSLSQAEERANQAALLSPESAWSQSALSTVEFARRNWSDAKLLSARTLELDPDDLHLVEFDALISLFSGDFERVLERVSEAIKSQPDDSGFVFQNALGSAKFHTGDFAGAVQTFENAIAGGAPTGPVSVAYLMAAHYRLGNYTKARELAQKYQELWPQQRVDKLFGRVFRDPDHAAELASAMDAANGLLECP
ncbi:MAG: tetratricopeptide repeat protein, partial [Rhizobiaceae bacterium]